MGMILLNPISDLIGRKMTLYLLWVILVGVSRPLYLNHLFVRCLICA